MCASFELGQTATSTIDQLHFHFTKLPALLNAGTQQVTL
jgi:hypothetical protein